MAPAHIRQQTNAGEVGAQFVMNISRDASAFAFHGVLPVQLVQPAFQRGPGNPAQMFTDQKDIYVEVIGSTNVGVGNSLIVRRDVPYLLR